MRLLIAIILSLAIGSVAFADLKVSGKRVVYELTGRTLTESDTQPENATEGEKFRNIDTNELYVYTAGNWTMEKKTTDIKDAIAEYKAEVALITDNHTKKAVKALGRVVLKLFREVE